MHFRNWKVARKQFFIFGILLLLMGLSNGMSINNTRDIKSEVDQVTGVWMPRLIAISSVNFGASDLRLHQLQYAVAESDSLREYQTTEMVAAIDRMNESLDRYIALTTNVDSAEVNTEESEIFERFDLLWEDYQDISMQFIALSRAGQSGEAIALLRGIQAQQIFDRFRQQLLALEGSNVRNSQAASDRAGVTYQRTHDASFMIFLVTLLLCAGIAFMTARVVTRPIRQLTDAAGLVAAGDLDVRIPLSSTDEVGLLARSFNEMTTALKDARQRMQQQADKLRTQNTELQETYRQLEEKSHHLEEQKLVTERKNADLEETMHVLRETQEQLVLREKMAGLGTLVAGVAHEINNPIGMILSTVDTSERCLTRIEQARPKITIGDAERALVETSLSILRDNVGITRNAGRRIANLVRSLGSFAHVDESEFQIVDIRVGIEDSITLLGSEALRDIEIVRELDEIPRIPCHPAELNQVFFNVLRNAAQAIDKAGTITVRTISEGPSVKIEIADTGRGIPEERLRHVFDFGFSKDASRIKMGSGLTTSYRIIQRHNGDIQVESTEGKGTTVTITLPTRRR